MLANAIFNHIMKSFLFFINILFCSCSLFSETVSERLSILEQGSSLVYELPQSIVGITVTKKDASEVTLDVVTTTKDVLARESLSSWADWLEKNMPSASFKDTFSISLPEGKIIKTSAEFHNRWLLTLLSQKIEPISTAERKKAGAPPMPGERDFRPVWQPRVIVQGEKIETTSTAYSIHWPDDGSPLSIREIILYFPDTKEAVTAFPYMIESPSSRYKAFVLDSKK